MYGETIKKRLYCYFHLSLTLYLYSIFCNILTPIFHTLFVTFDKPTGARKQIQFP